MTHHCLDSWQQYPALSLLSSIPKPPQCLYYQGHFDPVIFENCVTVVGSRRMTNYGRSVLDQLVPHLVLKGKTIISGFMYGVDQYAHQSCLDAGGKTVAVLGWGIDQPLEGKEAKLAQDIIDTGGLLLSEWDTQKATMWTFPVRDRILAGLSSDTYVVEAALKSGSLITAQLALKFKRQVWAAPGPITSRTSEGTNSLIAQGKAKLLQLFDAATPSSPVSDPISRLLQTEPLTANEIALKLNQPIAAIGAQLSLFSVTGQLVEREGKYYLNHAG